MNLQFLFISVPLFFKGAVFSTSGPYWMYTGSELRPASLLPATLPSPQTGSSEDALLPHASLSSPSWDPWSQVNVIPCLLPLLWESVLARLGSSVVSLVPLMGAWEPG